MFDLAISFLFSEMLASALKFNLIGQNYMNKILLAQSSGFQSTQLVCWLADFVVATHTHGLATKTKTKLLLWTKWRMVGNSTFCLFHKATIFSWKNKHHCIFHWSALSKICMTYAKYISKTMPRAYVVTIGYLSQDVDHWNKHCQLLCKI